MKQSQTKSPYFFNVSHHEVFIYTYTVQYYQSHTTVFITYNVILGRHVSTSSESSSGPQVQIQG